jgi:flagellar hook-associated protein 2
VATATSTSTAVGGAFTFTVNNLATSASLISSASVTATTSSVTSGNLLLSQAAALGFSSLAGDQVLATGSHSLTVTTSTGGATLNGTSAPSAVTTVTTGVNDGLSYTIDGVAKNLTLAAGTYSANQLASAVAAASNGDFTAQMNGSGNLALTTTAQGSAHSASITGGTALAALGLVGGTTGTGTDGAVSLDGGPSVTVSDAHAGAQITLTSGAVGGGTVTATLAGGLTAGTTTLQNVSTATGSLADVISAINSSGAGMSATAVGIGNGYRLQVTSTTTGAASGLTLGIGSFMGTLGNLNTLQAGTDATLTVGSGLYAYQVTSATNTATNVLPGVTIGLLKPSTTPVTVTVGSDSAGLATKVQSIVDGINSVINQAKSATNFDANSSANNGPLLGDSTVEGLAPALTQALTGGIPGTKLSDASSIGITVNTDGTIAFDQTKFESALAADPASVQALFTQTNGNGIAQQLKTFADGMSNPVNGSITAAIQGTQADSTNLTDEINAWQPILDLQRQQLTQEFTTMETTLATLKSQSAALGL